MQKIITHNGRIIKGKQIIFLSCLLFLLTSCGTDQITPEPTQPIITASPSPIISTPTVTTVPYISPTPKPPTETPQTLPLPELEVITVENANRVELLRTMYIPNYEYVEVTHCNPAFSPDGRLLAGACGKNQLPVWDVQSGELVHLLYDERFSKLLVACDFSPDGKVLASGGYDEIVTLWDVETGEKLHEFKDSKTPVWDMDFSADGRYLVVIDVANDFTAELGKIRLWDMTTYELVWDYTETSNYYLSVTFSPDDKYIAYGKTFGVGGILDAATGEKLESFFVEGHIGELQYSPSGKYLGVGTDARQVSILATSDYSLITDLKAPESYINGVVFTDDESLLISGTASGKVMIWDMATYTELLKLTGHRKSILRISLNPQGTIIASISWDGTVRLWGVVAE